MIEDADSYPAIEEPSVVTEPPPPRVKRKYVRKAKPPIPDMIVEEWGFPEPPPVIEFTKAAMDTVGFDPPLSPAIQFGISLGLSPVFYRDVRGRFVISYVGLLSLCMGSGELIYADARPVQDKDKFALDFGQQILQHAPWDGVEGAGPLTGAWAQLVDKKGFKQLAYVAARDIPARAGITEGFMAEEIFRKVALMDLIANSPLQLTAARLAMEAERSLAT